VQIILSNSQDKEYAAKIKIRPVKIKDVLYFQETIYRGTQVFHENFSSEEISGRIEELLSGKMKQAEFVAENMSATILVSKKGKMTIKTKKASQTSKNMAEGKAGEVVRAPRDLSHNREKQYILREGEPVDFLVGLGVQTPDGKIAKNRYDKFRQINRYLEFIEDILDKLPMDRTIRIIDFGCGKSYLTFAMYYYLHVLQKRDIVITGLDLKKDVIAHCNKLAKECGYERLTFEVGDISTYEGADAVDMVVSLHACDTATDYAIEKAIGWGAEVIMAVPCCQHEVNKQISCAKLQPILKYGLIKERISALITDAVRANLLEEQGYDTQIVEFIDMEHTPKNLLIRAVKRNGGKKMKKERSVQETLDMLHIDPTLKKLLEK
jgi:SAM-dependent methyltransferase